MKFSHKLILVCVETLDMYVRAHTHAHTMYQGRNGTSTLVFEVASISH